MPRVVVVGAGLGGCAAALAAAKAGVEVIVLEKMDTLGGLAPLSGVLLGDGGFTAAEEAKAMGGGDLFAAMESITLHHIGELKEGGKRHVSTFDVFRVERALGKVLDSLGVKVVLKARVREIKMRNSAITHVVLEDGSKIDGGAFVDATGGSGNVAECKKYGFGCVMCHMRCPTFGGRVSLSAKAGIKDLAGHQPDGAKGAISSGFMLVMDSLGPDLAGQLRKKGYALVALPVELINQEKLARITATHNVRRAFIENLFIFDVGVAKVVVQSYMPLAQLHSLPGLENARFLDPLSGGMGNAVRALAMCPRDDTMKVSGTENLYCAGEKAGPQAGIPGVIVTGLLAGHNAARNSLGKAGLELSHTTAIGDYIAFLKERTAEKESLRNRYGFGAGAYFERMVKTGLYTDNPRDILVRVEKAGLREVFARAIS